MRARLCRRGPFLAALLLLALQAASGVRGQEPAAQTQPPIFRTGVSLVRVDVTVTDHGGAPIADLRPDDFEIEEDGVPQQIDTFQFVSLSGESSPGDDTSLEIRSREHGEAEAARDDVRVFAIFLDDYHVAREPATTIRTREALTDFVKTALKPTDLVAVMDPLTPISALRFTRSRDELLERFRKFEGRRGIYMPVRSVLEEAQLTSRNVLRIRAEVTLSALEALVTHLGALRERRTSVLFLSEGPPTRFGDGDLEHEFQAVVEAANRFNVTINCLDPHGLTAVPASDTLWRLAGETGGRALVNTNDLRHGMDQVVRDASAYYLIGYTPTRQTDDGAFHRIEVRTKRRGVRVLARKGYWAPSAEELAAPRPSEGPPDLLAALGELADSGRRRWFATWVGFEPGGAGATRVQFVWQQTGRPTTIGATPAAVALTLRDAKDQVVEERRLVVEAPAGPTSALGRPVHTTLEAPPGTGKLSVSIEGAGGDVLERVTESLSVPLFRPGAASLATPRVLLARSALEYRALSADPRAAIPSPLREFRRTDRLLIRVPAILSHEVPSAKAELQNRGGATLLTLPLTVDDGGTVQIDLPLSGLAAADYVLRVTIESGEQPAGALVAFRVVP